MAVKIDQEIAQQIVDSVKEVCGCNINFISPDGTIFVSTDPGRVGTFHEVGRMAAAEGRTIEVKEGENFYGTQAGVNIPFVWKGEILAVIGISGDPEKTRRFALLAQRITTLILKEQELNTVSNERRTQMGYAVRVLTRGGSVSRAYFDALLEKYGLSDGAACRCILIRLNARYNPANLSMISRRIESDIRRSGAVLWTFNYPEEYVLIVREEDWKRSGKSLVSSAPELGPLIRVGIGTVRPVSELAASFAEADLAAKSLAGEKNLALFEDLDLEILLANVPEKLKKTFVEKTAGMLDEEERKLLETYFTLECSLKATSEALYRHKNTIQYQLDRIAEKTGCNPRTFREAVVLYLGVLIQKQVL